MARSLAAAHPLNVRSHDPSRRPTREIILRIRFEISDVCVQCFDTWRRNSLILRVQFARPKRTSGTYEIVRAAGAVPITWKRLKFLAENADQRHVILFQAQSNLFCGHRYRLNFVRGEVKGLNRGLGARVSAACSAIIRSIRKVMSIVVSRSTLVNRKLPMRRCAFFMAPYSSRRESRWFRRRTPE